MTDKVQKIREEVERMHNLLPIMDGYNISINYADRICTTLEMYIDSLQEEPIPHYPKVRKATGKLKECIDSITEERLKKAYEGLEEGSPIKQELDSFMNNSGLSLPYDMDVVKAVYHMANWQKQQFLDKAESFFEEYLAEEDCKFGASEWTELKSKFSSLDDFEKAFKHYINKGLTMEKDVLTKQEKKSIYLLYETVGQYEDMHSYAIQAFYNKEEAEKECERLSKYYDNLYEEYQSIDFSVSIKKFHAFMQLLKEVNPEEYARAEKAFNDDTYDESFDYDEFHTKIDEFSDTPELYDYLRKTGCTEEEIHLIEVEKEVADDLNYDFPSYYVSQPIELN